MLEFNVAWKIARMVVDVVWGDVRRKDDLLLLPYAMCVMLFDILLHLLVKRLNPDPSRKQTSYE